LPRVPRPCLGVARTRVMFSAASTAAPSGPHGAETALASMAYRRGQTQARSRCWFGRCPGDYACKWCRAVPYPAELGNCPEEHRYWRDLLQLQLGAPGCFVQTCEREAKQRNRIFHGETSVVVQRPRCCGRVVHAARSCGPLFVCVTQALAGTFSATASNNSLACSSTRLLGSWRRHWACGSCHRACAFAPAWAAR